MTREEAIKLLTQYIDYDAETPDYYKMEEACKVAIEALEQEPCEDCISRADLISLLIPKIKTRKSTIEIKDKLIPLIKSLNPIQPKSKTEWIPVSEKLPEKSGLYLVTNRANEIEVFSFTGHDMARVFWSKYAKAWMPLPEPYKPTNSDCNSCKNQNEVDGSNCYECVKGIRNNYTADSEKE